MVKAIKISTTALCTLLLVAGIFFTTDATSVKAASIPPALNFALTVGGLNQPVFITNAGDGSNRLFIVQQLGQIRIFKSGILLSAPFLNISGLVSNFTGVNGEQGLLGLAFDPNYANNGFFYITYTTNNNNATFPYTTTLARYHVSSGNADLANTSSSKVLLSIPKKYTNHNGGMIAFGPDGYLYMSMGDGGSGGDPDNNAQNIHTLLGKILRIDVDSTPAVGQNYVIPPTNPFYGSSDQTVKKEIWAYGVRNPWRFSFDRSTGDFYIGDVGQNIEEEIDFQASSSTGGQNYGWSILEGNLCYNPSTNCVAPSGYVPPVTTYDHGNNHSFGCSVTGGYVYRGSQFEALQGVYFYGDFCSGKLLGLIKNPNDTWTSSLISSTGYSISSFGEDEQGELYLADYAGGKIYHIIYPAVTITGNVGVEGVTLSYVDVTTKMVTSQRNGSYSLTVPSNWTGTVTPSHPCFAFSPTSHSYGNITINQTGQDFTPALNPSANCADLTVSISGTNLGRYGLPATQTLSDQYSNMFNGPVKVVSSTGAAIFPSERTTYGSSFHETTGIPNNQLTTDYWFPWYDYSIMRTWISVGNPSVSQTANVSVYIGGQFQGSSTIVPQGHWTPSYPGVFDGPVEVKSTQILETAGGQSNTPGIAIVVSERTLYGQNFNETNGIPDNRLASEYWFPWYDFSIMQTWISVGNPSTSQAANVSVYIAGQFKESMSILPSGHWTPSYQGVFDGPVQVKSTATLETAGGQSNTPGIPIIATERTLYEQSFNETSGIRLADLTTDYWLPTYDSDNPMQTWISVGNPSTSQTANVSVYLHGQFKESHAIPPSGRWTPKYDGVVDGPLQVKSTAVLESQGNPSNTSGIPIFISARTLLGTSFSETNGMPANQLDSQYWFTWYDTQLMQTWLYISRP